MSSRRSSPNLRGPRASSSMTACSRRIVAEAEAASPSGQIRSSVLPLVEHSLTWLWERRDDGRLRLDTFRAIGGLAGGLSRWAEETYQGLSEEEQEHAHRILVRLSKLGDERPGVRRGVCGERSPALRRAPRRADQGGGHEVGRHATRGHVPGRGDQRADRRADPRCPAARVAPTHPMAGGDRTFLWLEDALVDVGRDPGIRTVTERRRTGCVAASWRPPSDG